MVFSQISRATDFSVGAPQKGKRGQTFAPITTEEKLLQLTSFSKPLLVPFEAGVYQETGQETRINLDAVIDGELLEIFDALDASFESQMKAHNEKSTYHPMVTRSEHGNRIRMKVNTEGPRKAQLYNMKKERLGGIRDVETAGSHGIPVVAFTKGWWMGGQHGVTMELRHCVITEPPTADFDWPLDDENPF